jgi:hypothetical protein
LAGKEKPLRGRKKAAINDRTPNFGKKFLACGAKPPRQKRDKLAGPDKMAQNGPEVNRSGLKPGQNGPKWVEM